MKTTIPAPAPLAPAAEAEKLAADIETIMQDGLVPVEIAPRFNKSGKLTGFFMSAQFPDVTTKAGENLELSAREIAAQVTEWAMRLTLAAQAIHRRYTKG